MASSGGSDSRAPLGRSPSGTITFVFTDVEGSTRRWERYGGAMQAAMRRHDALLREALAAYGGHVFKTVGDAFCAAFERADDAVAAALAVQGALAAEDFADVDGLRVRVAIHTGVAEARDGDYFGPALNRVARLLALGAGAQTLVSRSTAELARDGLGDGAVLEDLGEYRLRDLDRTERVFQLWRPGLERAFPPLRSGATAPTNLPTPLSSFVGRELELAELTDLLADHRLVTLVGTGGVGKTRLSIRVAETLRPLHPDGTWFVDLSAVTDPGLVVAEFSSTFGVRGASDRPLLESLVLSLAEKHALIVVDNCEHVVDVAAETIAALLARCGHLAVVATSREALRVDGEQIFALDPLAVPALGGGTSAAEAMRHSAVVLLLDRARAAGSRFRLTDANAPATSQLCRQLDALPFALELAASRMTLMSPQQMLDSLAAHYDTITSRSRGASRRTSSLETLIGWSHALLSDAERTLFRRLSIFAGSWTLDRAASVAGFDGLPAEDVLEHLASLVSKSMVVAEGASTTPRFRFLESTRRYAAARMDEAGERATLEDRLRAAMAVFARDAGERQPTTAERTWLGDVEDEIENVRVALATAFDGDAASEVGAEIVAALGSFWYLRRQTEGTAWLARARDRAERCSDATRVRLLVESARIESDIRSTVAHARAAVGLARAIPDGPVLARALEYLGQSLINSEAFDDAERCLNEAIAMLGEATPAAARPRALRGFARLYGLDDRAGARADFERALAALDAAERGRDASVALRGLAQTAALDEHYDDALRFAKRALALCEDLDDSRGSAIMLYEIAYAQLKLGETREAIASVLVSMRALVETGMLSAIPDAAIVAGSGFVALDELALAAVAFGFARARIDALDYFPRPQARRDLAAGLVSLERDGRSFATDVAAGEALASAPHELVVLLRARADARSEELSLAPSPSERP